MNKNISLKVGRLQIIAIGITLGVFLIWTVRIVSSAYQKGVISGRSVRVALVNSCTVAANASINKPNFTGCNSIL